MKKLFLVSMLCLTFTIPAKADFWKKLKNAVIGTDATSSSNSSGITGGTRRHFTTYEDGTKIIVTPFDTNAYKYEDDIYKEERNSTYMYRNLQGSATKLDYIECKIKPGNFLNQVGYSSFYGYVKFPVYKIYNDIFGGANLTVFGCFSRDKTGKEKEISDNTDSINLDHELAMYIWDNQLTVTTLSMKNGKAENGKFAWFDSTNPEAEIYINGKKFNIK